MRTTGLLFVVLLSTSVIDPAHARETGQGASTVSNVNGYIQLRYQQTLHGRGAYLVRRAKFWGKGSPPGLNRWFYKVQFVTSTEKGGRLRLQDAYAEYCSRSWSVRLGQLIPNFSLERSQPDFILPVLERAEVVNVLHPASGTDFRDIGISAGWSLPGEHGWLVVGVFNGSGANHAAKGNLGALVTGRLVARWDSRRLGRWWLGGSIARRRVRSFTFTRALGPTVTVRGWDERYGIESSWHWRNFSLQSEALWAQLGGYHLHGGYQLVECWFYSGLELVGFWEDLYRPGGTMGSFGGKGVGLVWQGAKNRLRCWCFAERRGGVDAALMVVGQLQVMFR